MSESVRLTDKIGVVGIDGTDYGEYEEHQTTIDTEILKQGIELLDTLGWEQVDVCTVSTPNEQADYPMLMLKPPHESLISGDQAGIAITPRTEEGRKHE
jgi:hypothetical protein